ncbi:MAG TPA: tetratricopeptide repeat protein [Candidatus Krumholzibacteriaceae bacterium]|nr:tetratricopeptide repeat protein [Candidatus Krumholzibacteriaceae bacterium]
MKPRRLSIIFCSAALVLVISTAFSELSADTSGNLVSKGNDSFRQGDYKSAAAYYQKASVEKPESPVILFNTGAALYKEGDFKEAREYFQKAAEKTRELNLESRAWYNMGNCSFREGQRQADSDLEKALEHYKESVRLYGTALEKDSTVTDAALNMEVARIVIKDLLDRIKQREEKKKRQQKKMREIVDSLVSLADRQDKALQRDRELTSEKSKGASGWKDRVGNLQEKQKSIKEGTAEVNDKLKGMFDKKPPSSVEQALSHIDSSLAGQNTAVEKLSVFEPEKASDGQKESSEQLRKAVAELTDNQDKEQKKKEQREKGDKQNKKNNKQKNQQQKKEKEKEPEKKVNETAKDILSEEKKNREKRKRQSGSGYRDVDKDW